MRENKTSNNKTNKDSNNTVRSNATIWKLPNARIMADTAVKRLIKAEEELKVLIEAKQKNRVTKEFIDKMKEHPTYKAYADKVYKEARKGFGLDKEEANNLTCDLLNEIKISEDDNE